MITDPAPRIPSTMAVLTPTAVTTAPTTMHTTAAPSTKRQPVTPGTLILVLDNRRSPHVRVDTKGNRSGSIGSASAWCTDDSSRGPDRLLRVDRRVSMAHLARFPDDEVFGHLVVVVLPHAIPLLCSVGVARVRHALGRIHVPLSLYTVALPVRSGVDKRAAVQARPRQREVPGGVSGLRSRYAGRP